MRLSVCLVFVLYAVTSVLSQDQVSSSNQCTSYKTCAICITSNPNCAWCEQEGIDGTRCDTYSNLAAKGCDRVNITNPTTEKDITKADPLTEGSVGPDEEAVQVHPQEMSLKIRPNNPYTITMQYRQAEDYPVDLYYLMDLSNSMKDDKDRVAALGDLLADKMREITKNFRLGFGSFVDKTVMPYVSTVPDKLNEPCTGCAAPYGFKNHLSLTVDTPLFAVVGLPMATICFATNVDQHLSNIEKVNEVPVSGNLDSPEGGMDALIQAIACENEIGWRKAARHLVIFSTDASFHYAGDGKLGGIVKPNDGHCHMRNNEYTMSTELDYPSISQLISMVKEKSVNLIFAVTENTIDVYEELRKLIDGSTAGILANDSSNIVDLVQENYDKIRSELILTDNKPENVTVKYRTSCLGTEVVDSNKCLGLKVGDTVNFDITVTVNGCPKDGKTELKIKPVNINEELVIKLDVICECDCEKPENEKPNSPYCNGTGTYECGICSCPPGFKGRHCECDAEKYAGDASDITCRLSNDTNAPVCYGRGECICGECECYVRDNPGEKVWGDYCECDNFSCGVYNGLICGGSSRGSCFCGKCDCLPQYAGDRCQCPSSNETCMASNGKYCAGHGVCECGRCKCDPDSLFRGPTCEDCPTCQGQCDENRACVQCVVHESGDYKTKEECDKHCSNLTIVKVDKVSEDLEEGRRLCQFKGDDGCTFYFTYEYNDTQTDVIFIQAQETKVCPPPINVAAIIAGVVGGIVAVGLALLLIWKLLTTIHDRREFAKFEKERQNAKWDTGENPIYKQATSTFKNPTYGGN